MATLRTHTLVPYGVLLVTLLAASHLAIAGPVIDDGSAASKKHHFSNSDQLHMASNSIHASETYIKEDPSEDLLLKKLNSKCVNRDTSSCLVLKLVTYFNRILKKSTIEFGDIEIIKTESEADVAAPETSRSLQGMSEDEQISQMIQDKAVRFISTRAIKFSVTDDTDVVLSGRSSKDGSFNLGLSLTPTNNVGDARKKNKGGMGMLMAAAMMKIGLLKALAFKALVLLVGKALLVSKLALVLASIIGLKKLLHSEKHVTYEVVAHPHHEHHEHAFSSGGGHDSYGHGWGRNLEENSSGAEAQQIAYNAQIPVQQAQQQAHQQH